MRLLRVFFDVDLRCSHHGLKDFAKQKSFDVSKIKQGDMVVFLNRRMTMLKAFASGDEAIFHLAKEKRIEPETIKHLPRYFDGNIELTYKRALATAIDEHMKRRRRRG